IYIGFIGLFIYKTSKKPIIALSIYILLFYFRDCITLRNSLADIFLLLALYAYTNKELKYQKLYFIIGIVLAGSFHISFLAFLVLLCSDIRINYKLVLILSLLMAYAAHGILGSIVSMDLFSDNVRFQNKYGDYLSSSSWFSPIVAAITLWLNYILVKKSLTVKVFNEESSNDFRIKRLLNISTILFGVIIFTSITMVTMRYFYNYFMFAYIFIYNRLYCENIKLTKKLKNARTMYWCVVIWVFLWLVCFSNISVNIPVILRNNSF
ncbi:MAG: EpsG family protein, partial [Ruminococcus sp.]|nr:EpsG family protein [Ruminococcus sp.]